MSMLRRLYRCEKRKSKGQDRPMKKRFQYLSKDPLDYDSTSENEELVFLPISTSEDIKPIQTLPADTPIKKEQDTLDLDRFDHVTKAWTGSLQSMPRYQQIIAERIINNILFEAQNLLNELQRLRSYRKSWVNRINWNIFPHLELILALFPLDLTHKLCAFRLRKTGNTDGFISQLINAEMANSKKLREYMMPKSQFGLYPKKFIIEILEIYKNCPCLWKTRSEEYFDRIKKDKAYNIIVDKLQEVEKFPDRKMAISLFSALRFHYRKQLKLVEQGQAPKLWYFSHLDFIREHLYSNRKNESLEVIVDDMKQMESPGDNEKSADLSVQCLSPLSLVVKTQSDGNTVPNSIHLDSSTDSSADLTYSSPTCTQSVKLCHQYEDSLVSDAQEQPSEQYFDELSKTWASILRSIPSQQEIIAEKLINDIIFEAHMEKLNAESPLDILNVLHAIN